MWLQDAEEALGLGVELIEIDRLRHERVSAGLQDLLFVLGAPADGDDDGFIGGIRLYAAADVDSIHAGNHDVENQQVGFEPSDFDQGRDAIRCGGDFVDILALQKRFDDVDDFLLIINDQNAEFPSNERSGRRNLVPSQKRQQVVMTDAAMAARRPIRSEETLLDPIDHGPGIHVEKTADLVCCIDSFGAALGLIHHGEQKPDS